MRTVNIVDMEAPQGEAEDPQLTVDATQSDGLHPTDQAVPTHSRNWHHNQSQSHEQIEDQSLSGQNAESWKEQQQWRVSLQQDFQNSNLSPALPLLPATIQEDNTFTDYSLFQPSDNVFSPLRPNLDTSLASESFQHLPENDNSLSQHPLLQDSVLSEEEQMSSGFLYQQSSLLEKGKSREKQPPEEEDMGVNRAVASRPPEKQPAEHLSELSQDDVNPLLSSSVKVVLSSINAPGSLQALLPNDQPHSGVHDDQSGTAGNKSLNVSIGPRSSQPDDASKVLLRELQYESRRSQLSESPSPPSQLTEGAIGLQPVEHLSPAVHGVHREPDIWSSASQAGVGGTYLGILPQSQSTPGVSTAPRPTSISKDPAGQFSTIQSDLSEIEVAPLPIHVPSEDKDGASSQVQSLPSVSFKQKVDAWRANQGSASVSLFDTLALQGFSGVSPKQKAFDAVSDTLNGILSQKLNSLNLTPAAEQSSFEEVKEKDIGSAPGPSASTHFDSQSHMDLDMHVEAPTDLQANAHQQQLNPRAGNSAPLTLDQFSGISLNPDSTLSFSQGSHGSRAKLNTSAGASSILSLEVDNYAPYWTSATLTPPPQLRPREVNIEERIPLYLHNLGIDQSPATILNPFAPRGPIREPEFSPTDLLTIKGSVGTSTRSSHPSEGGSPQKGEFSQSSIQSSLSIPVSLDSLGAAAQQEDEDSYPSTVQTVLRQHRAGSPASSRNTTSPGEAFDSDLDESSSVVGCQSQMETAAAASAAAATVPHTLSAEDILLSLQKTNKLLGFSDLPSGPGVPGPGWAKSSSDSVLTSGRPTLTEQQTSEQADLRPQNGAVGRSSVSDCPLPLSQASRRAEPEGCSAAADTPALPLTVVQTPPTVEEEESEEAERLVLLDAPTHAHAASPTPDRDNDLAATLSDVGSESSLAVRVAELLQRESSAVASTSSTNEQEGSKAAEWLRLKMSGQQCEPLELDREDRMRIEEIKRELLMLNPITDSTDTESSVTSGTRQLSQPVGVTADHKGQQSLSSGGSHSGLQLPTALSLDMEVREGPRINPQAFTSITITTRRRTPSPEHSSSPGPPLSPAPEPLRLSQLSGQTLSGLELNLTNQAAAAGQSSRLHIDGVQLRGRAPPSVQISDLPLPELTSSPGSSPTPGHVSFAHITLSPNAVVGHSLPPAGQPRHSSTLLSPDKGLGLSSPPEWSEHREPKKGLAQPLSSLTALSQPMIDIPRGCGSSPVTTIRPPTTVISPRDATTARVKNSESPDPVLLPYKPHGSEEPFYIPHTRSLQSDIAQESRHTDSDDAVTQPFSTHILGRADPTVGRGVSIRHTEGIYSKRLQTSGHQGAELRAVGGSSQMELDQGQRSSSQGSAPTSPHTQRHQDSEQGSGSVVSGPLDQLWLKFCSQWRHEKSRLSGEREASLLERLERLSRVIGIGEEWKRERGGRDVSAGRLAGGLPASSKDWTQTLLSQEAAAPAGRGPSNSVSATSSSVSTVDTTRLAQVFGAERVRRLCTSASIHKLHKTIQEQKKGKNKEAAPSISQSETSDQVAAESDSSANTFTLPDSHHIPTARKPVGLVSRGVQAGSLQLDLSSRTGRHTRNLGLGHAHSPSCSSSTASERGRGGRSPARASRERRIFPKSISWFISVEELGCSEARKENQPAKGTSVGRSSTWFLPYNSTAQWREPLRQRQVPEDRSRSRSRSRSSCHSHRTGAKTTPPAGAPLSLQEALRKNRPEFIHQSRQRVERLLLRSEDRRLQELYKEVQEVYSVARPRRPAGAVLLRRAVPRMEMIQRSKQIYETLPEVLQRQASQRRKAEYELYRLNARLYNKKITSRVLNKRAAWN